MTADTPRDPSAASSEMPIATLPEGDYAIVEQLGHTTFVGRVTEIERFGSKMLQIEPVFQGELLAPVLIGGSTIYRFTACTAAIAATKGAREAWQLPSPVRAVLPPALLAAPQVADDEDDIEDADFAPAFLHDE